MTCLGRILTKNLKAGLLAGAALLALAACGDTDQSASPASGVALWPVTHSPVKDSAEVSAQIEALIARMSLEEKVGQIMQAEIQYITPAEAKAYHIGSILNGGGSLPNRDRHATPTDWLKMADDFYDASLDVSDGGVAIPIIWGSDAVHGHNNVVGATIFPHNIALGAARDPDLIRRIGEATAQEVRVTGIDWTFAPTLAVARNDRWGRTYESYSENPDVVWAYAAAMVEGLQGVPGTPEFLDANHVVATAKHFLGDGGTEEGDDQGDAKLSEQELVTIHGAGYGPAINAGVQSVMASFSSWNGVKMHGNHYLLTDVLKDRMGFDGLVVGDWNGHGQLPGCTNASCAASINAGVDLIMVPQDWKQMYENTLAQAQAGEIPLDRLDDAVRRILRVKERAGLFEKGKPSERGIAGKDGIIGSAGHRAIAREAVRKSLVLLKNKGHVLPINPTSTILVAGDGADNIGKQSGGWSVTWQGTGNSNADFPGGTSIYKGISDAVSAAGGKAVLSADGSFDARPDVAVVVFGENPYAEGQGDVDTLEFEPGNKKSLAVLKALHDAGIPTVSVFLSGRPLWVNPELNASDAFVAAWLPGTEGEGVADVLVADTDGNARHDFHGRLSFSWPKLPKQDVLNVGEPGYDPLFAFGYGLSYDGTDEGPADLPEDVPGVLSGDVQQIALYAGRPMAPWHIMIGDSQTAQILSGAQAVLTTGTVSIHTTDKDIQEDALLVRFEAPGSVFMEGGTPLDLSGYLAANGLLSFDIRVDALPEGGMDMTLGCGNGCERRIPMSDHLKTLDGQGWQRLAVRLSCLADDGDTFNAVPVPFRLESKGKGAIAIANIRVEQVGSDTMRCPAH
ncbi:MAG: glycoside hydrolase family 3 protein [Alphaproteobacteria bacterium]|nr:MAG: glycoside hydrolase family 3 protein [Alphaproteobacteria bacterium]